MNFPLPAELDRLILDDVQRGSYRTVDEFLEQAVRLLLEQEDRLATHRTKPFEISLDPSKSVRSVVQDLIQQAEERQRRSTSTHYVGALMHHLVAAKLDYTLGLGQFAHHSFSTADEQSGQPGDFVIADVSIHVTTSLAEAVIARCRDNLNAALRPVIVTLKRRVALAEGLAEDQGVADRIDILKSSSLLRSICTNAESSQRQDVRSLLPIW